MRVIATRKVDELGRVVLPFELRRALHLDVKSLVDICVDDNGQIVIRQSEPSYKICGETENLTELHDINSCVCLDCMQKN